MSQSGCLAKRSYFLVERLRKPVWSFSILDQTGFQAIFAIQLLGKTKLLLVKQLRKPVWSFKSLTILLCLPIRPIRLLCFSEPLQKRRFVVGFDEGGHVGQLGLVADDLLENGRFVRQ